MIMGGAHKGKRFAAKRTRLLSSAHVGLLLFVLSRLFSTAFAEKTKKRRAVHGHLQLGLVDIAKMAPEPILPNWHEQNSITNLYASHQAYDSAQVVASVLGQGVHDRQNEGKLGDLTFFSNTLPNPRVSAAVVAKLLEGGTGGLDAEKGTGLVVLVGPIGDLLREATKEDLPTLHAAGGSYLFPRILLFGEFVPMVISWMQGSDRLLKAIHAAHQSNRFESLESWNQHPASFVGVSKGGLDALSGVHRMKQHYPNSVGRVITVAAPIAQRKGSAMDLPNVSKEWIRWHAAYAGKQAALGVGSIRRSKVQQELEKLETNLGTLKRKHLDLAVYSSLFSKDFWYFDPDLNFDPNLYWYLQMGQKMLKRVKRYNDGLVFAPIGNEPNKYILRFLENHEKATRGSGAIDQALRTFP